MDTTDSGISLSPSYRQLNNEFRFESKRLQTFESWPIDAPIESARVAKAGFYFTGHGCEVQCFACGGKISQWNYGDQAVSKHRQMNPSCPFLLNRSSNVPIHLENENSIHQTSQPEQARALTDTSVQRNSTLSSLVTNSPAPSSPSTTGPPLPMQSRPLLPNSYQPPSILSPQLPVLSHHEWLTLRSEEARLRTFDSRFTAPHPDRMALAKAGFFYLGVADHVQCPFCRGVVRGWEPQDDPQCEHLRLFPNCPFILGLPVGNIPIESNLSATQEQNAAIHQPAVGGFEVAPRFSPESRPAARPDTEHSSSSVQVNNLDGNSLEHLGITKHSGPRFSSYSTYDSRLKSFRNWPTHLRQTPTIMAQAGFFYLGVSDHVNCFHCGSGLRNWEPEDDPWIEHARWFPQCRFVSLMKGEQFIREAAQRSVTKTQRPQAPFRNGQMPSARDVSEAELMMLLDSPIVQTVLAMGIDMSRVKMALKMKMRTTGQPFSSVDSLLEATITLQHYNEHRLALEDSNSHETVEWWSDIRPTTQEFSSETTESESDVEATGLPTNETSLEQASEPPLEQAQPPIDEPLETPKEETLEEVTSNKEPLDRTQMLEEEIRRLKEARLCKVCLDEEVSIAYIPCGHIVTCTQCAAALEQCPLCRKNIKGTVKIFFS